MAEKDIEFLLNQPKKPWNRLILGRKRLATGGLVPSACKEFVARRLHRNSHAGFWCATLNLNLKIELGRTHMYLEDVLKLRKGSVVPLDKTGRRPGDVLRSTGRLIARGEVARA